MSNDSEDFQRLVAENVDALATAVDFQAQSHAWLKQSLPFRYSYNFEWLGRPIIQYPQDMVAVQELIWRVRPDLIVETGIAHGGSLVLSASMLALLDYADAARSGTPLDPTASKRRVIGIDIDIRAHNRAALDEHPLRHLIELVEGSSIDPRVADHVRSRAQPADRVLVLLDSNHTHDHVLAELEAYAPLVSMGSYCVVFDTVVERLEKTLYPDRPWGPGDSPMSAVDAYLRSLSSNRRTGLDGQSLSFAIDHAIDAKLQISVAPRGYLRRTRESGQP
jgi:cephalosporin hydroxylase